MTKGSDSGKLPDCPHYVAHPQAVWFEEHWRPRYDQLAQELAAVKKELAEVREEKELFLKDYIERCRLYVELEKELVEAKAQIKLDKDVNAHRLDILASARAEIAKLQKDNLLVVSIGEKLADERDELRAEIERLNDQSTKMREACADYPKLVDKSLAIIAIYEKALNHYATQNYYNGGQFTVDRSTAIAALVEAGKLNK